MNGKTLFTVTREKHLDHMVRVVPIIVLFYGIQYYMVFQMGVSFTNSHFMALGLFLVLMIAGFISYDLHHKIECKENHINVCWGPLNKNILYQDILAVEIPEDEKSFSTVKIVTKNGSTKFFFVDQAKALKLFIEDQQKEKLLAA